MQPGTEAYFFLDTVIDKTSLTKELVDFFLADRSANSNGGLGGNHEIFGRYAVERVEPNKERVERFCLKIMDCDLLPELAFNPPDYKKNEEASRLAYHFIRSLFSAVGAKSCWGAVAGDQVAPFDTKDPCLSRIFKFTKTGPQKLVKPYEEGRSIRSQPVDGQESDFELDPASGQSNWVLSCGGPLKTIM